MVLVLMVEMGMDMVLVREIEMKDDRHVRCQIWASHALCFMIPPFTGMACLIPTDITL